MTNDLDYITTDEQRMIRELHDTLLMIAIARVMGIKHVVNGVTLEEIEGAALKTIDNIVTTGAKRKQRNKPVIKR